MGVPVKQLNQQHPAYSLYAETWERLELLSAGGVRLALAADRFLMKRPKEVYDVYQERIRRFRYQDILGTALGWYTAQLFRQNPHIEIKPKADDWYAGFLLDCDRAHTSFIDKFRTVFGHLCLYGLSYVLIDKPHADAPVISRADEKQLGLDEPYLVTYSPRQVINWGDDENGNLKWVVIKCEETQTVFLGANITRTRWYYFNEQVYRVYEAVAEQKDSGSPSSLSPHYAQMADNVEAELIDENAHALAPYGTVPVHRITVPESHWLASRVYLQLLDHLNHHNAYSWALFQANLAMPVIFSDTEVKNFLLSEVSFLQLGEKDKIEWMEPKGASFEHSAQYIDGLREEIFRTMYLQAQGRSTSATASAQSGVSKQMDMMPATDALNGFGDVVRQAMQDVGNDVSRARGDEAVTFDVNGFHFESQPITQAIGVAEEMADLGIFNASPTLEKEAMKTVAMQFLEDRNDDLKQAVMNEIDAAPTSAERDAAAVQQQQQAFAKSFNRMQTRGEVSGEQGAITV